jgi:hypothetical protein
MDNVWKNREKILEGITNTLVKDQEIEKIAKERLDICHSCVHHSTTTCAALIAECCGVCGCSLKFKTRSMSDACPKGKWLAININK